MFVQTSFYFCICIFPGLGQIFCCCCSALSVSFTSFVWTNNIPVFNVFRFYKIFTISSKSLDLTYSLDLTSSIHRKVNIPCTLLSITILSGKTIRGKVSDICWGTLWKVPSVERKDHRTTSLSRCYQSSSVTVMVVCERYWKEWISLH